MAGRRTSNHIVVSGRWTFAMAASAIAVLTYCVLLAFFSQTRFPSAMHSGTHWPWLMDKPVGEDGYYMLTVADNIAAHGTITYNGGIPATGIQPLATVIFAGLDLVVRAFHGGPLALIRTVLIFSSLLFILFAWQLRRLTADLCRPELAGLASSLIFLLAIFDYTLFRLFTYGLETGIYLVCIAACVSITVRILKRGGTDVRDMVLLGVAGGLAGEARIDFGLLFAVVLGVLLARRLITAGQALVTGAIAFILVSPWFLFVHHVSSGWLPSSGSAESTRIAASTALPRLSAMFVAIVSHLAPWSFGVLSRTTLLAALVSCCVLLLFFRLPHKTDTALAAPPLRALISLWLPGLVVLIVAYYALFNSSQFYYRYASPIAVLALPLMAIFTAGLKASRTWSTVLAALMAVTFAFWTAGSLHTGNVSNSQVVAAGYIQRTFPNARVAAFQSGVLGYFDRNVENLDGKLNAPALEATREHALPQFLDREKVDVLIDWPTLIYSRLPAKYLARYWVPCPVPVGHTESVCIMRKGMTNASGKL